MDSLLDDARARGLIEDLPDGGIRMRPELEFQMPMLYEIIRECQREELNATLNKLHDLGLLDLKGVDAEGELVFQVTQAGIDAVGK